MTLKPRSVSVRVVLIMSPADSLFAAPSPKDPRAPAFETAAAMAGVDTPAIGA